MSQENVEIVRRVYDAAVRRDDATPFQLYAEDITWDLSNSSRATLFARRSTTGTKEFERRGARHSTCSARSTSTSRS